MWRPPVGEGGSGLRIDPSGAVAVIGRTEPSLFGIFGVVRHLIAWQVIARV